MIIREIGREWGEGGWGGFSGKPAGTDYEVRSDGEPS